MKKAYKVEIENTLGIYFSNKKKAFEWLKNISGFKKMPYSTLTRHIAQRGEAELDGIIIKQIEIL